MNHLSEAPSSSPDPFVPRAPQMTPVLPPFERETPLPATPQVLSYDDLEPEPEEVSTPRVDSNAQLVAAALVDQALRPLLRTLQQMEDRVAELENRLASASRPLDAALAHALDGDRRRRRVVALAAVMLAILVGGPLVLLVARYAGLYAG